MLRCPQCEKELESELDLFGEHPGLCQDCWYAYRDDIALEMETLKSMFDDFAPEQLLAEVSEAS